MSRPTDVTTDAIDPSRPWLGLSSFTERTRDLFFGRDHEIHELLDRIDAQPLTVLFGLSGRGKSSLLGAGVVPQLREAGARPVVVRLRHEGQPLVMQVREAWDRAVGCAASDRSLWERAHSRADRDALRAHPPVIVLDQFEEVFTLGQSQGAELQPLFRELAGLVENRVPQELRERLAEDEAYAAQFDEQTTPARVVITLREDYLAQLEAWKGQLPALMRNRMVLHPLNGPQALEAVVRPGRLGNSPLVDTATATAIVRFVAQVADDTPLEDIQAVPPLLSLLCFELNEARLQSGTDRITLGQLEEQGANILQNFYLRCFEGLPDTVREAVESPLIVSESGHRNACTYPDLLLALKSGGMPEAEATAAVARLVDARLLTRERIGGAQRIELTHDLLTALVVRSRNERRARQQLAALEAEKVEAEQRTLALEKSRRVLQGWVAVSSLLAVLAVAASGYAWFAQQKVRDSLGQAQASAIEAKRQASRAAKQTDVAKQQTERARAAETIARQRAAEATRAETKARESLAQLQAVTDDLRNAQQATTETLALARRNIDEVLSVLESPEMDQVHGFSPIERELMAKLVPLERQLSEKMGKDFTPDGAVRTARLQLRAAKQLRESSDQLGAAGIYLDIHERIRRLPASAISSELREIQFRAIYYADRSAHLLLGYDRDRILAQALAAYHQSHFAPGGQYWREAITLQIAKYWTDNGRSSEALALLEEVRPTLTGRVTTHPEDLFAIQVLILLNEQAANVKDQLGQHHEAAEDRARDKILRESAQLSWPRSLFLARVRLSGLFDDLNHAQHTKNEQEHARLVAQAQAIIDRFRGASEAKEFEAAEAKLNQVKAEFQRWVKLDGGAALAFSLESLRLYGVLYADRSVTLQEFDALDDSFDSVNAAFDLQEQHAEETNRAALRAKHGLELIELSAPFATCANALQMGSACNRLVRKSTSEASARLHEGKSSLEDSFLVTQRQLQLLRDQGQLFLKSALAVIDGDQRLPNSVPHSNRPSTEPLMDYCNLVRDVGNALVRAKKVEEAIESMSAAATRCEIWANTYDWDFYLRNSTSGLLDALASALDSANQPEAARALLARCWDSGLLACQKRYAAMLASGRGGPKDEKRAAEVAAYQWNGKRFTVPVRARTAPADGLTYPVDIYIGELYDKRRYKGIEDQAIWLLRNRGMVVSQDVRDSFLKLEDIARENKVSFPDLAKYALGAAKAEQTKPTDDEVKAVRHLLAKNGKFRPDVAISSDEAGVAIGGFDTVEATTDGKAVAGSARFPALHAGAIWLFKDDANRKRFERAPDRFMPAFGGFCVVRLAAGAKEPGLADYLIRHQGKLYLACSEKAKEALLRDPDATIAAAAAAWLKLADAPGTRAGLTPLGKALLEPEAAPNDKPKPKE